MRGSDAASCVCNAATSRRTLPSCSSQAYVRARAERRAAQGAKRVLRGLPASFRVSLACSQEAHADAAPAERLALAVEIRDGIEIVHSNEYINFLKHFFPAFTELLASTPPGSEDGPSHRLRNVVLEVLSRMPQNEVRRARHTRTSRCAHV